jgi:uncharacterized membrane protein
MSDAPAAGRPGRRSPLALAVLVLLTGLTLLVSYANKARCVGPEFDAAGRSAPDYDARLYRDLCYTDIQHLWLGRELNQHVVPYLHGGITADGALTGGSVEYPVLTGLLMWAGAAFARTDGQFLADSALLLAPFGLLVGLLLGWLSRWRALLWAVGTPLLLYAFHNWDLPAVACSVAAVAVLHARGAPVDRSALVRRASWAGTLLGLGFAVKLYPGAFVLPLALYVLTGGETGQPRSDSEGASQPAQWGTSGPSAEASNPMPRTDTRGRAWDWAGALRVVAASAAAAAVVNLPFALLGYPGWRASFIFQRLRPVDGTTNSIWYWGFRPYSEPGNQLFQQTVSWLSPTLVLASFALAGALGWRRYRRTGSYPWVQVSAAMLAGFLLLHKVHSPQYALWLVPFFVLLRVRWGWVAGYLAADLAIGLGIFRWFYALRSGAGYDVLSGLSAQAVVVGVWGRAALLVALFGVFLAAEPAFPLGASEGSAEGDGTGEDGRAEVSTGKDGRVGSAPGEDGLLEVSHPGHPTV